MGGADPAGRRRRRHHRPGAAPPGPSSTSASAGSPTGCAGRVPTASRCSAATASAVLAKNSHRVPGDLLRGRPGRPRRPAAELAPRSPTSSPASSPTARRGRSSVAGEWSELGAELARRVDVDALAVRTGPTATAPTRSCWPRRRTTSRSTRRTSATTTRSSSSTPAARRARRRARCTPTAARRSGCSTRPSPSASCRPTSTC